MTIFLTPSEQAIFARLSPDIRGKLSVQTEDPVDEPDDFDIRLKLFTCHSEAMAKLLPKLKEATDEQVVLGLLGTIDKGQISLDDISEIVFLLGPAKLGAFIAEQLAQAKSADDLRVITALSVARHELNETYRSPTHV
jgi:hypothetical protein